MKIGHDLLHSRAPPPLLDIACVFARQQRCISAALRDMRLQYFAVCQSSLREVLITLDLHPTPCVVVYAWKNLSIHHEPAWGCHDMLISN